MGIALLVIGACEIVLGGFCLVAGSPRYSREMNRAAKYAGWIGALLLLVAIILLANGGYDQFTVAVYGRNRAYRALDAPLVPSTIPGRA